MKSAKSETRRVYKERLGDAFDEKTFSRIWKTTTQHIRRITKGQFFETSEEAKRHLLQQDNILDYAYSIGGVRGQKETIMNEYVKPKVVQRTQNFIHKWGSYVIDGKKLTTWRKEYLEGRISKEEYYSKIEMFKKVNKKYNKVGS